MTFDVKYRDADGAVRETRVEAADRAACAAACRARGIAPTAIRACAREGKGADQREGRNLLRPRAQQARAPKEGRHQGGRNKLRPSRRVAAASVCLLLAVAGGVWWWFGRAVAPRPPRTDEPPGRRLSRDAGAKAARPDRGGGRGAVVRPAPAEESKDEKRARQLKQIRDKYGEDIPENLKPVVYFLEHPPTVTYRPAQSKTDIFKRRSEREIASMILTEPGTWFMRRPVFDSRFDDDFRASLGEAIDFSEDDTDEQRALKQAVSETKADLAERMKAGESPSAVMNAFAGSLYELGQYRRMLQDELGKIKRDAAYSDQDVLDFVAAANKMLKAKGGQPIPMPKMVLRHVSLQRAAARAAEKAAGNRQEKTK